MSATLGIVFDLDYAQDRVKQDGLTVLAEGSLPGVTGRVSGWDAALCSNLFQDKVTWTAFPLPNVFDPAWNTTVTGDYARLGIADFTFLNASKWKVSNTDISGDNTLHADNLTADETAITVASFPINTPMYVGGFQFNSSSLRTIVYECGWADTAGLTSGVGLRFYSDGETEVWKAGSVVGVYKIGGDTGQDARYQNFGGVALLPCRKRELLVISKGLAGFSHTFADLDESDTEPTITDASKFWLKFPVVGSGPRSANVQVARIKTKTSMTLYSVPLNFPDPPLVAQGDGKHGPFFGPPNFDSSGNQIPTCYADLYGGTAVPSLLNAAGTSAFVPDDTVSQCRIKIVVTSTGLKMTGVDACLATYAGLLEATAAGDFDLAEYVHECSLRVGERADATEIAVQVVRLEDVQSEWALDNTGEMGLKSQSNRPLKVWWPGSDGSGALLMGGRTGSPKLELGYDDSVSTVSFEVHDRWKALEEYVFRDKVPLDGFTFKQAIVYVASAVLGAADHRYEVDTLADDFVVPSGGSPSRSDYGFCVQPGDRGSEVVERLFEAYAGDWFYGFVPVKKDIGSGVVAETVFRAKSPASLPTEPSATVYLTVAQAKAALVAEGFDDDWATMLASQTAVRSYRQEVLRPEATEVRVTGWDPRSGKPVQAVHRSPELEDPSISPGLRPEGWVGEKLVYGFADIAVQGADMLERATLALANRLSVSRRLAEWECGFLFHADGSPVWRGDCVRIDTIGDFRVTSIQASFVKEPNDDNDWDGGYGKWAWRPTTYTGELIDGDNDGWRASTRGCGLSEVRAAQDRRRAARQKAAKGSEHLLVFGGIIAVEVP